MEAEAHHGCTAFSSSSSGRGQVSRRRGKQEKRVEV